MPASNLLLIVSSVNQLLSLLTSIAVQWPQLRAAIDQAVAEGRQFGPEDLLPFLEEWDQDLTALDEVLIEAERRQQDN